MLEDLLLTLELTLHLINSSISIGFDSLELLFNSISLLLDSLDFLFETSLLRHHALGANFEPLVKTVLLFFEFTNSSLELVHFA